MLVAASQSFDGLSADERRDLRVWQISARAIGIDAAEDLTTRPWPCPVGTVIGLFTAESKAARWLVVGEEGAWAVAFCAEGHVSERLSSLAEALAVIHPGQRMTGPIAQEAGGGCAADVSSVRDETSSVYLQNGTGWRGVIHRA